MKQPLAPMMILFLTRKLGAGDKPCPDPAMVWGDYHRLVCECLHEIPKRKVGSYQKKKKEMDQCVPRSLEEKAASSPVSLVRWDFWEQPTNETNRYTGSHAQQQDLETEPRCWEDKPRMGCKNCYRHIILVKFCTKERFKGTLCSEILQNPPRCNKKRFRRKSTKDLALKFSKTHQDEKRDSGEKRFAKGGKKTNGIGGGVGRRD